jgi:hypothetical protein
MIMQSVILRQHAVRRVLRIPVVLPKSEVKPVTFKESIDHLKKWFREQNKIAQERAGKGKKW